jgi:hypothetical protein
VPGKWRARRIITAAVWLTTSASRLAASMMALDSSRASTSGLSCPGRFHPQLRDKNRRDLGKSPPKRTASTMETPAHQLWEHPAQVDARGEREGIGHLPELLQRLLVSLALAAA